MQEIPYLFKASRIRPGITPECKRLRAAEKAFLALDTIHMAENADFRHIVRIANTDLAGEKKIVDALRKIKGVSFMFASAVCTAAGVDKNGRMGDIKDADIKKLQAVLEQPVSAGIPAWMLNRRKDYETGANKHLVVNDLSFTHDNDLKRLKKIRSYRGVRHQHGLPVRGQRTRSNFRKNKGKKR